MDVTVFVMDSQFMYRCEETLTNMFTCHTVGEFVGFGYML